MAGLTPAPAAGFAAGDVVSMTLSSLVLSQAAPEATGVVTASPFNATRPSATIRSISRREAMPARASSLAMRCSGREGEAGFFIGASLVHCAAKAKRQDRPA